MSTKDMMRALIDRTSARQEQTALKIQTLPPDEKPLVPVEYSKPDDHDQPSRFSPALIGGAGAIVLVGGVAYSFSVDSPKSFEQPRHLYSAPAITIAAGGGVVVGVAVYLWLRRSEARLTPSVALTRGGGAVGWSTSF